MTENSYYAKDGTIWKHPVKTGNGITVGFPVCTVDDKRDNPKGDAEYVAYLMNMGERYKQTVADAIAIRTTPRGSFVGDFEDVNGRACSVQESSRAVCGDEGACIWLGCDDMGLKAFEPNGEPSWRDVDLATFYPQATSFLSNTRMHLSQADVKRLLPVLRHFADHGELPGTIDTSDIPEADQAWFDKARVVEPGIREEKIGNVTIVEPDIPDDLR